jgi:cytochrome c biogenesis protein CcmG/thiol:disulfide interchange protein DsbE
VSIRNKSGVFLSSANLFASPAKRIARRLMLLCAALLPASGGTFAIAQGPIGLLHKPAPAFTRPALDRQSVSLADLRGKVVLLNFWATWCAPCQLEMPRFVAWQKQYGPKGLQIVGVAMEDDAAPVRALTRKLNVDYPVVMGDAQLGSLYGEILGLPVSFLIDRQGRVVAVFKGETDLGAMERRVRAALGRP